MREGGMNRKGLFLYRISVNFLGVPVRKSRTFMINPQIENLNISTKQV
jgi:hypothetical protein